MRIIQFIDSLEPGGAERMAVNYANALVKENVFSGLITSRSEGVLKDQIDNNVDYLYLNKKNSTDVKAFLRLRKYVSKNKIELIHAHSSSYFWAVLLKVSYPKIKIIWHDHYGNSEFLQQRKKSILKPCSFFFNGIIVVNTNLLEWAKNNLLCKTIHYIPNFAAKNSTEIAITQLEGNKEKRIVCLANLRPQKNHLRLLRIAKKVTKEHKDWSFHLVGKDFNDEYSKKIKEVIVNEKLEKNVFIYGSKNDISYILSQANIGILTSDSEGLPVALLEYGLNKLPVVATNVGEISSVVTSNGNGYLCEINNEDSFVTYLDRLITNEELRNKLALENYNKIENNFSEKEIIKRIVVFYTQILKSE